MNDLNVREATSADTPAIVSLWRELMDYHAALDPFFRRAEGGEERFAEWVDPRKEPVATAIAALDKRTVGNVDDFRQITGDLAPGERPNLAG